LILAWSKNPSQTYPTKIVGIKTNIKIKRSIAYSAVKLQLHRLLNL